MTKTSKNSTPAPVGSPTSKAPQRCQACPTAHNSINGRYCNVLRGYVEHYSISPCIANASVPSVAVPQQPK